MRGTIWAAVFALFSGQSAALTLDVDGIGQLLGASGIRVGDDLYTVVFTDLNCNGQFACDPSLVADSATGSSIALAIMSQVMNDGEEGNFDSDPSLTRGCESSSLCQLLLPFGSAVGPATEFSATNFTNSNSTGENGSPFTTSIFTTNNLSGLSNQTYAYVTDVAAVPLPAGVWLLLSGLGALVCLRRRA